MDYNASADLVVNNKMSPPMYGYAHGFGSYNSADKRFASFEGLVSAHGYMYKKASEEVEGYFGTIAPNFGLVGTFKDGIYSPGSHEDGAPMYCTSGEQSYRFSFNFNECLMRSLSPLLGAPSRVVPKPCF